MVYSTHCCCFLKSEDGWRETALSQPFPKDGLRVYEQVLRALALPLQGQMQLGAGAVTQRQWESKVGLCVVCGVGEWTPLFSEKLY
jgi:hypothetical protein